MKTRLYHTCASFHQTGLLIEPCEIGTLHKHEKITETYIVQSGIATIEVGEKTFEIKPGEFLLIPTGTPHRISNKHDEPLMVLSTKNGASSIIDMIELE